MKVMAPNRYLFTVPQESHYNSIINQGPWNVTGFLLFLQPWSLELAIDEVKLQLCSFWVQVHNLPFQYITTKNAIKIGKGIGKILKLETTTLLGLFVVNLFVSKLRSIPLCLLLRDSTFHMLGWNLIGLPSNMDV